MSASAPIDRAESYQLSFNFNVPPEWGAAWVIGSVYVPDDLGNIRRKVSCIKFTSLNPPFTLEAETPREGENRMVFKFLALNVHKTVVGASTGYIDNCMPGKPLFITLYRFPNQY